MHRLVQLGIVLLVACVVPFVALTRADEEFALPDTPAEEFPLKPATVPPAVEPAPADDSFDALIDRLSAAEERLKLLEETPKGKDKEKKDDKPKEPEKPKPKKWYEKLSITGYTQLRINEVLSSDDGSAPAFHNGDSSIGENQSFLIRRARLILAGDVTDRISVYFQPDFAANVPGSADANHFVQIRDWYADLHFDLEKEYRVRVGQSKVPYGWENLQSSRNRVPLDRNDAFNSATRNERDLGAFFYWTPEDAQEFFKYTQDEGLKGSGNYGVFGVGVYNGQGGSFREQNDDLHLVSRLTIPWICENGQRIEAGVQALVGEYTVLSSPISPQGVGPAVRPGGTLETGNDDGIIEERIGGSFIYYPQPFGFQSEWTVGRGPGLNEPQTFVEERALYGGYAMLLYRLETECYGEIWPFVRWSYYKGGYRSERNAPFSEIDEWEIGVEWQMTKNVEFVGTYTLTDRTNTTALAAANTRSYRQFEGDLLRFQLQVRF
jgi:hypothetical protein